MTQKNSPAKNSTKSDVSLFAGFVIVTLFFLTGGFVTYTNILILKKDAAHVAQTHEVIIALDSLLSIVKDAETGQRGYLLTGKEEYLSPYETALRTISDKLNTIQILVKNDKDQEERLPAIKNLLNAKLEELARTIDIRRKEGFEAARAVVQTDLGADVMNKLRSKLAIMSQAERNLRLKRQLEMEDSYKIAIAAGIASSIIGILLNIIITHLLRHAAELRKREEWFQNGQVGLSQAMLGNLTLEKLSDNVLRFLAEYFEAHSGVFFVKDETFYFCISTYGISINAVGSKRFEGNENLLGQAAIDQRSYVVRNVPNGYMKIESGLGYTTPCQLIITPAVADGEVTSVIELGFINALDKNKIELLNNVSNAIGIAVQSAKYRENLKKLLEETQSQAESLQIQSEELRVSNEELEEQSHTLQESQGQLELQQAEMQQTNTQLENQTELLQAERNNLKKAQESLEFRSHQLEISSKYKSEFLANMSHELRTPLNSLLILARSLSSNEDGNLTKEQVEEAQIIHNGGLELLSLINDILDLSKVEAGKLAINLENISIQSIVKKLTQQFDPIAKEKFLDFKVNINEGLSKSIHTDIQRVEQILKNLLSNAFKFTQKGSVTLEVSLPENDTAFQRLSLSSQNSLMFKVIDTGIGISSTKLNDIFEAFQQEDGSIDRHYGGTGLGLTIARKLAHMLGGEIHVASEKDKGSVFMLILPLICEMENPAEPLAILKPSPLNPISQDNMRAALKMPSSVFIDDDRNSFEAGDKILLIIEDDKGFAQTLLKISQKKGYKCIAANDGKTGYFLASEYPVSAIILDLQLPDIDGINVLHQLKQNLKTRHIPVHIMTGRTADENIIPLQKGAIGYLTKPAKMEEIDMAFSKIEEILNSEIKKILVVEDDKNTQKAIQNLLRKKDVEIAFTENGKNGLKMVLEDKFDCVVLDLSLPDMTGFEWLENVSGQTESGEPPPIIIYTARDLTEEENRKLSLYTGNIVIKGASSSERLLDEVTLFLHSVESSMTEQQQAIIQMQHDPDKALQGRTTLLVDDDMRNVFALSKILKKHGMNVIIADNGQMALEKLEQHKDIDLVIMDIMMPIMDGYQAIHEIRKNTATRNLPVIALTARAMPEEQERCIQAGANDYMIKPLDVERFLTLIRLWLFRQEDAA